jgi:hypothetical protein
MKKSKKDDIRPEYQRSDLGKGVRGKYLKSYQEGTNLVLLSPDVAEVFHNETAVNDALRSLIKVAKLSIHPTAKVPIRQTKARRGCSATK